jgi:hypothetical protein
MNMFRCEDMMIRNVVHFDKSQLSLVGRTFVSDGIISCKYFYSKDNYKTTKALSSPKDQALLTDGAWIFVS